MIVRYKKKHYHKSHRTEMINKINNLNKNTKMKFFFFVPINTIPKKYRYINIYIYILKWLAMPPYESGSMIRIDSLST